MTKVCRLCLTKLQRGSKYFNINAVESFTGFMPYRDQLTTCIPEMALDLIPNPIICNSCRSALKSAYDFKSRCLLVEKKIRQHVESCNSDQNYDLSDIPTTDLPPTNKLAQLQRELEQEESDSQAANSASDDSNLLLQLQKEVHLPKTGEIEITNVTTRRTKCHWKHAIPDEKDGLFYCTCGLAFPNIGTLHSHKVIHKDEFTCNFCKQSFKSLQYLRKHNNICSKEMNKVEVNPILTKRPHLPAKAKNHLKRWLFKHTEHPYPTDHEKQMLMQETNLSLLQVENWFINARRRILQDFTKLKHHGVSEEEIQDHLNSINSGIYLEDIIRQKSPPRDPSPKRRRNGVVSKQELAFRINTEPQIKIEPNIEAEPLEIISAVKCEMDDDR